MQARAVVTWAKSMTHTYVCKRPTKGFHPVFMSVTRGASPYLFSELRGHSAFVSSRNSVEVGSRVEREDMKKKGDMQIRANFSSMAGIYSVVRV